MCLIHKGMFYLYIITMISFCRHPFTPPKLCISVDEAKNYAAEYTLQTLGIPTETAEPPTAFAGNIIYIK